MVEADGEGLFQATSFHHNKRKGKHVAFGCGGITELLETSAPPGLLAGVSGPGQTSLGAHKDPGQPAAGIQRRQWKQIGNKADTFIFYSTRVGGG